MRDRGDEIITAARVFSVEKLQAGADKNLPVAGPPSVNAVLCEADGISLSDDDERSMLNLEMFGQVITPVNLQREIKNNCLEGLAKSLNDYIIDSKKDNNKTRKNQTGRMLQDINLIRQLLTTEHLNDLQAQSLVDYIISFKHMVEKIKDDIKNDYSFTQTIFSSLGYDNNRPYRNSRLYRILSDYTFNNRALLNNNLQPTSDNTVINAGVQPS